MTPAEIRDAIRRHIVGHHLPHEDPASLKDDTPLITGGILDSFGLLWMLIWVDDEFGVPLHPDDIEDAFGRFDTIDSVAREIESRLIGGAIARAWLGRDGPGH